MNIKGFYYFVDGKAYMVSDTDFKKIQKDFLGARPVNTNGRTLYPVFDDPSDADIKSHKTRMKAWLVRDGMMPTIRWYWQVCETPKNAGSAYKALGDGLSGFKMVRYLDWNQDTKKWELLPMVNHATPEQEVILDAH